MLKSIDCTELTSFPAKMPHVSIPYGGLSVLGFAIFSNSATSVDGNTSFLSVPIPKPLLGQSEKKDFNRGRASIIRDKTLRVNS